MALSRPHVGSYDAANAWAPPQSYCRSPNARTAVGFAAMATADVADSRHASPVPWPPAKDGSAGSHAMSPAATMTGSPPGPAVAAPSARHATPSSASSPPTHATTSREGRVPPPLGPRSLIVARLELDLVFGVE